MNPFESYMHVYFNTTHFKLYLQDYQWVESSSVFVNGFDEFEPITTAKPATKQSTTPRTTANPLNSASQISNLSFTFIITFILLGLCKIFEI